MYSLDRDNGGLCVDLIGTVVRWGAGLLVFLLILAPATAHAQRIDFPLVDPPNADGGETEPLTFIGNYCGNFGGVSLHEVDEQSFTVDIVGEPVVAYLVWSGRAQTGATTGDDTLEVSVNGGPVIEVTADVGLEARSDVNFSWFTYSHNLVASNMGLLADGENIIDVSGLTLPERHGAGLLVLSEDRDRCAFQAIGLLFGNDVLFHNWAPPAGPNSAVACFDFPAPPNPVEIEIQMFVGGVENPLRSNAIWLETGSGVRPESVIGRAAATELRMALRGLNGDEFDNYDTVVQDPRPVFADPGDTWGCVQLESPAEPYPGMEQGMSASWINLAARVPVADIEIDPSGVNPVGVAHTFTVTVDSSFGFPNSLTITPTVAPPPDSISDTCDTPAVAGSVATCTVTINSSTPGIFTATAEAEIPLTQVVAYVSTNSVRENSGPAIKEYVTAPEPAIDIEKATNGEDADDPTGPMIPVGDPVNWTYVVTNIGSETLTQVTVTDDQGVVVTCPKDTLVPGEAMTCTAGGTAQAGQYANVGTVTGIGEEGAQVSDEDPSHYFGELPAIDIEKATNGEDADEPQGPFIVQGETVTWTYEVVNIGNVVLIDIVVGDDQGVDVTCPEDTLAPDGDMTCTAIGVAVQGQYANVGTVVGTSPSGQQVTDSDPSHYFGNQAPTAIDVTDEPSSPGARIYLPYLRMQ